MLNVRNQVIEGEGNIEEIHQEGVNHLRPLCPQNVLLEIITQGH